MRLFIPRLMSKEWLRCCPLCCSGLAILLLIVSCTRFDRYEPTSNRLNILVPERWSVSDVALSTKPPVAWLNDFDDANLKILVGEALNNNRDLAAISARMDAALAQARIAGAEGIPTLSGGASASRTQRALSTGFQLTTPRTTTYLLSLNTNWELDLWGRLRNRKHAALADFQANAATFEAARLSLAVQVAKAWFNAVEAKLQVRLAEKKVKSFQHTLEVIQQGFSKGINSSLDIRLARADLANAESANAAQWRALDAVIRSIEILLGRYPDSQLRVTDELPTITLAIPVGLPSELLSRRPDLVAAERVLRATEERLKDENKNFLPSIALTGSGGTTGSELRNLLNFNFLVWSIAGELTQPLFQGGRLKAQRALARSHQSEALAEYAHKVLVAFNEVESALAAEHYFSDQKNTLDKAKEEFIQAESQALERYQKGLESITTLLDTQRRTFDAQRSFIEVSNQLLQNRLDLYLALGGGFELENAEEKSTEKP